MLSDLKKMDQARRVIDYVDSRFEAIRRMGRTTEDDDVFLDVGFAIEHIAQQSICQTCVQLRDNGLLLHAVCNPSNARLRQLCMMRPEAESNE